MSKLLIISCLLLVKICCYAQYSISGTVLSSNNEKLDYFHARLLSTLDSSFIVGGVFEGGRFELNMNKNLPCILEISYVGYEKYTTLIPFDSMNQAVFKEIRLKEHTLGEVLITAKRPTYKKENGITIVNVASTSLSESGSAIDILKRSPGLIVDQNDNVSVFGKGSPIVYINGKEVVGSSELQMLQSTDIKSIKIDKSPGVKYDADSRAIILIETKKVSADFLNAEIYNRAIFGKKYSNIAGLDVNNKIGSFTNYIGYQLTSYNLKNASDDYEINTQPSYVQYNLTKRNADFEMLSHSLRVGTTYAIDSLNELSVQYYANIPTNDINTSADQKIIKTGADTVLRKMFDAERTIHNTHNFTSQYSKHFTNKNWLSIQYDYASITNENNDLISEENLKSNTQNNYSLSNKGNYEVNAIKSDFGVLSMDDTEITLGSKISLLNSHGSNLMKTMNDGDTLNFEKNRIRENTYAGYFDFSSKTNHFSYNLGIRLEQTYSQVHFNNALVVDTNDLSFFPSAKIEYEVNDNFSLLLKYTRSIDRPSFAEINPNMEYIDSLAYKTGNPLIKPTFSNNFCFELTLPANFYFSAEYLINRNERVFTARKDDINPDILKYSYYNLSKSEHLVLDLSNEYAGKKFNAYSNVSVEFPFLDIPFANEVRKIRQPIWYLTLNTDYSILRNLTVFSNIKYQSKGEELVTYWGESLDISMGINTSFFNKRLLVAIQFSDIFNTSDMSWEDNYGSIVTGQRPEHDTQQIRFSLNYKFNNFKNVFKSNTSIQDEINRF